MVQWALKAAYRERIRSTPFQVMMSRAPPTAIAVLASAGQDGSHVDQLDHERIGEIVEDLVNGQGVLHDDVLRRVAAEYKRSREAGSKEFFLWNVLVARPRKVNNQLVVPRLTHGVWSWRTSKCLRWNIW